MPDTLVNDALAAFRHRLHELINECECVRTCDIEEAARAMLEAALIIQVREVVEPSEN